VVDGVIYLDTPIGGVIAVDGATGATKWKWTPTAFNPAGTRRGVSVGDGKVYTLSGGNRVVALNKDTGLEVWVVQPRGPGDAPLGNIEKVATVYFDGMVYVGTNDGNRNAAFALKSSDGSIVWSFFGGADYGTVVTDVNGKTIDAGATWGPPMPDGRSCAVLGGVSPWMHSATIELGMVYWAFGNVRSCRHPRMASCARQQPVLRSLVALT
jgi:outer membrane protein assembly factor BamB